MFLETILKLPRTRHLRRVEIGPLPSVTDESDRAMGGLLFTGCSLAAFVPLVIFTMWLAEVLSLPDRLDWPMQILFMFLVLSPVPLMVMGLLTGLGLLFRKICITVDENAVSKESRWIGGSERWNEPRSRFSGIVFQKGRRTLVPVRFFRGPMVHSLVLHHQDPTRCITLFESRSQEEALAHWKAYCGWLSLPALETGVDA